MLVRKKREDTEAKPEDSSADKPKEPDSKPTTSDDIVNVVKGSETGDGNQRNGYGQYWECGEMGHPRRECPVFLKRRGKRPQDSTAAALKGAGKFGRNGKGKGKGGKGK